MRIDQVKQGPRRAPVEPSALRWHGPSRAAFARGIFFALLLLPGSVLAPRAAKADFIFQIRNDPADQNGYKVTGTISTFEVPYNEINLAASIVVTSWDITITGPGTSLSFTPANSTAGGFIDISPTALTVASIEDVLDFRGTAASHPQIFWVGPTTPQYGADSSTPYPQHRLWYDTHYAPSTQPVAVRSGVAVPEPSGVVLSALGAVTVIAYGLVRNRRSPRRQGDARCRI